MASVEALKAASLEKAIANLKQQSKKDGRFFEIAEKVSSKTYADAIIEIMALNDNRRHNVCLQDRTLFMHNYHSENTLAKRCHRIQQDRNRIVGGLTQQTQEMKSQFSTFMNSKRKINQVSVDHIELGKAKYMASAAPDFVPQSDIFYLSRKNRIQRRTMANPERVSSLLSRARTMLQKSDLEKLTKQRKTNSARFPNETTQQADNKERLLGHCANERNTGTFSDEKSENLPPHKEEINFNKSFYVATGRTPGNENPGDEASIDSMENNSTSGRSSPNELNKPADINEKIRTFHEKMNDLEISETADKDNSNYHIYEIPKTINQPQKVKRETFGQSKFPPLNNKKSPVPVNNSSEEIQHHRFPLTSLSQVRIVPPSMNILQEEIKREEAVRFPHASSDRCAIRIAMCRDPQPISDKLHSVTSTRDIMLIRNMLESKRELKEQREQRLKRYQNKEKKSKKV